MQKPNYTDAHYTPIQLKLPLEIERIIDISDSVQDALISVLADDRYTHSDYEKIADVFWGAVLDEKEIKKEAVIDFFTIALEKKRLRMRIM